jgi:hypothetical protein
MRAAARPEFGEPPLGRKPGRGQEVKNGTKRRGSVKNALRGPASVALQSGCVTYWVRGT